MTPISPGTERAIMCLAERVPKLEKSINKLTDEMKRFIRLTEFDFNTEDWGNCDQCRSPLNFKGQCANKDCGCYARYQH